MPFLPLTTTPFPRPGYREMLPCRELAPYVRCFWTSWNERNLAGREAESAGCEGKFAVVSGRDALAQMIRTRGSGELSALLKDIHASERQLERLFASTLSLSPKKLSSLVRYQSLWQDVCRNGAFDVQDAVFAYGYFDQAHLLHDFKKFHGMSLGAARRTAALSAFYNTRA